MEPPRNQTCNVAFEPRVPENIVSGGAVHATTVDGAVPLEDAVRGVCRPGIVGLIFVVQRAGGEQGQTLVPVCFCFVKKSRHR